LTLRQGEGSKREVAEDGFVIEVHQVISDGFHISTDAMKEGRPLELVWELPAEGGVRTGKMAGPLVQTGARRLLSPIRGRGIADADG
jgi:hypothetical protein